MSSKKCVWVYVPYFIATFIVSFLLGIFVGWKNTSEIDMKSINTLSDKIDELNVQLKETQYELTLSTNRISYLEHKLHIDNEDIDKEE